VRGAFTVLALVAIATTLGAAAGVSTAAVEGTSCPPISALQLHSILGLQSSQQALNTVDDSTETTRYLCNGAAWNGTPPTSFATALQTARSGRGAAFGIEVLQPNESGPDVEKWKDKDFFKLTLGLQSGSAIIPGLFTNMGWPSRHLQAASYHGHTGIGVVVSVGSGPAKGLVAAVGCWWNLDAFSVACLLVEEAPGKPVVSHLNKLAAIAVPKVL
jgi:hypothetical protein